MATSVRGETTFSPTTQEFFAKNGFEEKEKEEEGGRILCKSKGFLPMNFANPKGKSFAIEGIEGGRSKVSSLKEKLAGGFSWVITLGFFNSSNLDWVLARSSG